MYSITQKKEALQRRMTNAAILGNADDFNKTSQEYAALSGGMTLEESAERAKSIMHKWSGKVVIAEQSGEATSNKVNDAIDFVKGVMD